LKLSIIKNKKLLVIILLSTYQNIPFAQGTWEKLNSPTDEYLKAVYFVDSLYGWAAGFSGTIIHTSNGGIDWTIQDSKTENNLWDIFFLNRNLGWAAAWQVSVFPFGTSVLKTTDGGQNWISSPYIVESCFAQSIFFPDSLNGWMGGKPFPLVRTTDGGITWIEAEIDSSTYSGFPVFNIKFYNSSLGYAAGGVIDCCGIIWKTTNGGNNWIANDTPYIAPEPFYRLHLKDSLNVLAVGGDFEPTGFGVSMYRTSDGGSTWQFEYIGISGVAWDLDFRTDQEVWAALGGEQKLIYSTDSGLTWTPVTTPDSMIIFKIIFPDSLHGFGVGMDGAVIKYKPETVPEVDVPENSIPGGYVLYQNYPNPFNPNTNLSFVIGHSSFVILKVYNLLGGEVATLVNEEKSAGEYITGFTVGQDSSPDIASGIYFYQLRAGSFVQTKKMVLLR
jgi:photosystem II stability/assembly factor-like uncharacterized protein